MAGKIFVNYRREDSAANALNIAQFLESKFGARNVFIDINRIGAGQDFPTVLKSKLKSCRVLIVVIGPSWLTVKDDKGLRRIDNPQDWVRLEIVEALNRNIAVIPVLVGGATLPKRADLPAELHPLVQRQTTAVTTAGFRNEMAGLARDIREIMGSPWGKAWVWAAAAALAAGALVYGMVTHVDMRSPTPGVKESDPTKISDLSEIPSAVSDAAQGITAGKTFRDCDTCPEMVVVPGGSFVIGSPVSERGRDVDEEPRGTVVLKSFAMGKLEVTRQEWESCISAGACSAKAEPAQTVRASLPIGSISWQDASEYVRWLSSVTKKKYRLPSEAEWEYAARAGNEAPRFWGFDPTQACGYGNVGDRTYEQASRNEMLTADQAQRRKIELGGVHDCSDENAFMAPAGSFQPNQFGLYDTAGNLWEWVEDCAYPNYQPLPADGSPYTERDCKVGGLRGGSFVGGPAIVRSANRFQGGRNRSQAQPDFGFRVVRELQK